MASAVFRDCFVDPRRISKACRWRLRFERWRLERRRQIVEIMGLAGPSRHRCSGSVWNASSCSGGRARRGAFARNRTGTSGSRPMGAGYLTTPER